MTLSIQNQNPVEHVDLQCSMEPDFKKNHLNSSV